jgi:hypothetical protein
MVKKIVLGLGVVLTLVGLLGFVNNPVIGLFPVNLLHNLVHLLTGVLAIAFGLRGEVAARTFSKVFGIVYLLVGILGLLAPGLMMSLLVIDSADNVLHFVLALAFLFLGFSGEMIPGSASV